MQGSPIKKNILGKKFGYLTVISRIGKRGSRWLCKCFCGKEKYFYSSDLFTRHNTSCGCMDGKAMFIHGLWKTRFRRIYDGMRKRCKVKNNDNYHRYGGRGIKLMWKDCLSFKNDMYESYLVHVEKFGENETQIDRINNDGNYCKENCRWVTRKEQSRNTSQNVLVPYNGIEITVTEYCELTGKKRHTIYGRLKRGWGLDRVLTEKIHVECYHG